MPGDSTPKIRAVLFDMDGTVSQFNIDYRTARTMCITFLAEEGLLEDGVNEETSIYSILKGLSSKVSPQEYSRIQSRLYSFYQEVEERAADEAKIQDGAREAIERLRRMGMKLAVVTNNSRKGAEKTLKRLGISDFFEVVITRDDARRLKPDTEGLTSALEQLGVQPHESMLVGDSTADVLAARGLGVVSVALPTGPFSVERLSKENPDHVLHSIKELPGLLERLNPKEDRSPTPDSH